MPHSSRTFQQVPRLPRIPETDSSEVALAHISAVYSSVWLDDTRSTARSTSATSIYFIVLIASNTCFATSPPLAIASVRTRGVICNDRPHLSLHLPHALSRPPFSTMFQVEECPEPNRPDQGKQAIVLTCNQKVA